MKTQTSILIFTTESGIDVYDCGDYLTCTLPPTDGTTGPEWVRRLKGKDCRMSTYIEEKLFSSDFNPTTGVITRVAILKGSIFNDPERRDKNIRKVATDQRWETPNPEVACLMRENFTNEELKIMGLKWIIVMHEPLQGETLLTVAFGDHAEWLGAFGSNSNSEYSPGGGFAFTGL